MKYNSAKEIIQKLKGLDDSYWADYILRKDLIYKKIDCSTKEKIKKESVDCGNKIADEFIYKYGSLGTSEYINELGLNVIDEYKETDKDYLYISIYNSAHKTVRISKYTTDKIEDYMDKNDLNRLIDKKKIIEVAVMHEIFHHIEEMHPDIYTRQKNAEIDFLKMIRYKVKVIAASEIAAVFFSKKMIGLKYSPCIYEVILLLLQHEDCTQKIIDDILKV